MQGARDRDKDIQIEFWQRAAKEGFTDERARASAQKFRTEFDALDQRLAQLPYLMGESLGVLDIAWFIYAYRLSLAGYPLKRLHPRVSAWVEQASRPAGVRQGNRDAAGNQGAHRRRAQRQVQAGKTLELVAGF